jgi:5-methyltetrahydropteroyltriglutamate--homocysteine methyltransferase
MERLATTPGLYPLPDDAKEELADLKGRQRADLIDGTRDDAALDAAYDRVRSTLIDAQREADLDRIVEGQARWDDMIAHPLAVHDNVETRGLLRYYDNNNFYREPAVTGPLDADGDCAADLGAAAEAVGGDHLQAVLPGPYSLADLATDDHYGDEAEFLDAIAEFLAGEVAALPDHATCFLLEPSLTVAPPTADDAGGGGAAGSEAGGPFADGGAAAGEAIDAVADATDAEVVAHTYWGALDEAVHAHLLDAGIDAIGYDCVTAHEACRDLIAEYGTRGTVALGVVDAQNTRVEDADEIRERVDWIANNTPGTDFDRAYVTPNAELFYLPTNRFHEKLQALGAATREVAA